MAAQCECADCRQYRLWRAEGTDEWQPDADEWNARSITADASDVEVVSTDDGQTVGSLSSH